MKKIFLLAFVLCAAASVLSAQSFYNIDSIQQLKLTFFQSNWDYKLDSLKNANEDAYLLAQSIEINGELFDSVGVKYKGNSSYGASNQKNPMHIELDYIHKNADYKGYTDIKLGNGFADPSFVREPLSYEVVGKYMDAPRANFVQLWINGTYWGVYSNQESVNKKFVKDHFYTDGENPFFKCTPVGGAGPGGNNSYPDLVYGSSDSSAYYSRYEIKSDYGWRELLALMDSLKNNPDGIESVIDVDRALWMIALNAVLVNLDSYTGAFAQNYYLYWDENERFLPVMWDLNMSFGGFPLLSLNGGPGGALSVTQMQNLDPLVQSTNTGRPLIQKLLANPVYKRQYLAHMRTILEENFADGSYRDRALALQAIVDAAVQSDTKKFYTYQSFINNIDQSVSGGGPGGGFGQIPGITLLMDARYDYLTGTSVLSATAPAITNVSSSTDAPQPGETVWITASITDAGSVYLGYRAHRWDIFQKTPMFDDGAHQDGAANDGVYGASFPADASENQYYIYAENGNAGRFSPERAEYEFYSIETNLPAPQAGDVVINEFLADNEDGERDEFDQLEDWLEIYNLSGNYFDLGGLLLSDDPEDPAKWTFPRGSVIDPGGYLIVWLDEDGGQGSLHANFKLSSSGEFLMLSDSAGNVLDSISFGEQQPDISFGRYPNGTGGFTEMPTTFAAANSLTSAVTDLEKTASLRVFPNPAADAINLKADVPLGLVRVFDARGQVVLQVDAAADPAVSLPLLKLPQGVYHIQTSVARTVTFVKL